MRLTQRNTTTVEIEREPTRKPIYDEEGYETGEYETTYLERTLLKDENGDEVRVNVSAANGEAQSNMFGVLASYDKAMITDWMNCPIDETYLVYVEGKPYKVKRVAKSLNYISYALKGVTNNESEENDKD